METDMYKNVESRKQALLDQRAQARREGRESAVEAFPRRGRSAQESLSKRLAILDREETLDRERRADLLVLMRQSVGAPRPVYHFAERPCGFARGRGFAEYLEGDLSDSLDRCSSCRWPMVLEFAS